MFIDMMGSVFYVEWGGTFGGVTAELMKLHIL